MKKIEKGIVFSNDIERILNGNNALDFSYEGLTIPSTNFLDSLRTDFKNDVNKIFEGAVTILSEEEMLESIYRSISDVYKVLPHHFIRQNLLISG